MPDQTGLFYDADVPLPPTSPMMSMKPRKPSWWARLKARQARVTARQERERAARRAKRGVPVQPPRTDPRRPRGFAEWWEAFRVRQARIRARKQGRAPSNPAQAPLMLMPEIAQRVHTLKVWVESDFYRAEATPRDRLDARAEWRRLRDAIDLLRLRDYQRRLDTYLWQQARDWVEADAKETEAEMLETMGRSMPRCPGGKLCPHPEGWRHRKPESIPEWVKRLIEQRDRVRAAARFRYDH